MWSSIVVSHPKIQPGFSYPELTIL